MRPAPPSATTASPCEDLADIVAAGRYLRASLGAHESAWTEAVDEIGTGQGRDRGDLRAAALRGRRRQNGGESRIKNPGGYFRALARMVKAGKIDLGVELLAMRRRRMS